MRFASCRCRLGFRVREGRLVREPTVPAQHRGLHGGTKAREAERTPVLSLAEVESSGSPVHEVSCLFRSRVRPGASVRLYIW